MNMKQQQYGLSVIDHLAQAATTSETYDRAYHLANSLQNVDVTGDAIEALIVNLLVAARRKNVPLNRALDIVERRLQAADGHNTNAKRSLEMFWDREL
jgi:hypothetical protein